MIVCQIRLNLSAYNLPFSTVHTQVCIRPSEFVSRFSLHPPDRKSFDARVSRRTVTGVEAVTEERNTTVMLIKKIIVASGIHARVIRVAVMINLKLIVQAG